MKIKFFNLLIAMTLTTAIWAAPTTATPTIVDAPATECLDHLQLTVELNALYIDEARLQETLATVGALAEDGVDCEVTIKVVIGPSWGSAEVSVTFTTDCDNLVAAIKAKIREVKDAMK